MRVLDAMAIARVQKTERQPLAAVRKPPHIGPITGPMSGPMLQTDIARPRLRGMNMSATELPPIVIGVEPATPVKKRKRIRVEREGAYAHPMVKIVKRTCEMW